MIWALLANVGILAASLVVSYFLRPESERRRAADLNDLDFPRAEEGDAVPLVYGTARLNSPIVVQLKFDGAERRESGGVFQGFEYQVGVRLLLCRVNARVDHAGALHAQLVQLFIGDQQATLTGPHEVPPFADPAGVVSARVDGPADDAFEGLTRGYIIFYDGRWDQDRMATDVDDGVDGGGGSTVLLADRVPYRGYVTLRLWRWIFEGTRLATVSPVIFNPCVIPGYESTTGALSNGDCNPAAVLYDLLTNPWGGVGNSSTLIDIDSFIDAAAVLEDEQHGCSLVVTQPNEARTLIEEVLRQIDGYLYQNMDTNRYVLKLAREDYDPSTIPEFTMSNVLAAPDMPSTLWAETYNQVRVVFTDPAAGYRPATAVEQDLAAIAINGGKVRAQEIRFSGCRDAALAQKLAARELNAVSRPIYTIRMVVNRQGWNLTPGDVFKFTWSEWNNFTVVFRVVEVDLGELHDGRITVAAVQDRFSIVGTGFDPPNVVFPVGEPPTTPDPIIDHLVTEAPRWIQVQAFDQGLINSPDVQRSYSLARPEGTDSRYRVDASISGADEEPDLGGRAFPATFTLAASYAYYQGPYDTTIGILVENLDGALTSATATEIREQGRNLIALWDDEGHHEILSFESAADLGGGTYQLENVSRGLLDTVPRTWAGGTPGAVLPGTGGVSAMGRLALRYGSAITTHMPAASGSTWTPTNCSPTDSFTAASRTLRPVRGADLEIDGTQQPDDLEEGGVALTWRIRNRTTATITRGDAADESAESGQTYDAVAYKGAGTQVVLVAGHTSGSTEIGLGKVGHGDIEVGVDTKRTVTLPDGSTPVLRGWQVPTIPFRAHHWRNLLVNGDFAGYAGTGALDGWTAVGGTAAVSSTTPPGSAGYYARGAVAGGTATIQQDVDVTGYPAHMLTAALTFLCRLLPDSTAPDDTVTVTLYALDSGGATVTSTTYGPASPATWTRQYLSLANLDVTVTTLRVRAVFTANGGGPADSDADVGFARARLTLGQQSSQLLTNPSFEDGGGGTTGWTAGSGTWQVIGTGAYEQTYYTRPNDGASAQLWQKVTLPTGHELAAGVLEFGRANDAADDTGEVLLEALDGGGAVLDSVTTGAEAIGGSSNVWVRRRLVLDPIPATATELRVTINATRVTGTPLNACFDDFDLRTHKHLDADQEVSATWDAPTIQYLPRTAMEWKFRFPTITGPDYAIYDGTPNGRLGIEPLLSVVGGTGARLNSKALAYDGTNLTTTAFEGYDTASGAYVATNPTGTAFCNFSSATSFTVLAFVRLRADAELADGFGICGRMADGVGWELRVTDSDAYPMVRVTGDGGAASVTGTTTIADGALHAVALVYTAGTNTLRLITTAGTSTASTAAIGELSTTVPGKFRILWAGESEAATFGGQVLRVYVWRSAVATADVQAVMTYVETGDLTTQGRAGTGGGPLAGSVACVVGSDAAGVLVDYSPPDRPAILFDDASDRYGLLSSPDVENLATSATTASTGTVTENAAADPTGHYRALLVEGNSGEGWALSGMTLGGAGSVYVRWMAKASASHHANIDLMNDAGSVIDTDTVSLTTSWQVFDWTAAWDGSTAGVGGVRFAGSDDGTDQEIYLCRLVYVGLVPLYAGVLPVGDPGPTAPVMAVTLTNQVNREGEVEIEVASLDADCTLVDLHNGTNDNDRRTISWNADAVTPIVASDHYNASGTNNANGAISGTAIDPTTPWTARLRWNRAGTLDASTYITDVRAEQGATVEVDQGRNVVFTASTTVVDELELGHKADGSAVMAGVVFGVTVRAREEKVDPP